MCCQKRELLSILGYLLCFILLGLNITVIGLLVTNFQFGHYTKNILWTYILRRDEFHLHLTVLHLNQIMKELAINLLYVTYIILLFITMYCVLRKFRKLYTEWLERYLHVDYYRLYSANRNRVPLVPGIEMYGECSQEQRSSNVDTQPSRPISVASVEVESESSRKHERSFSPMDMQSFLALPIQPEETRESGQEHLSSPSNVDSEASCSIPVASVETGGDSSQKHEQRSTLNSPYLINGRSVQQIAQEVVNFRSLLTAFKVEKSKIHIMTNDLRHALMSRNEIMRTALRKKLLATANDINGSKFIKAIIDDLFIVEQETRL